MLIVLGGIVVALQGVSYVRDRQEVSLGPIEMAVEERGFISRPEGPPDRAAGGAEGRLGKSVSREDRIAGGDGLRLRQPPGPRG